VYIQKFCTAWHEFEPAFQAGVLTDDALRHVRSRLLARLDYALAILQSSGLADSPGVDELVAARSDIQAAASLDTLLAMTERIHQINHVVCEGLEA
jgi:hypothetical protein